MTHRARAVLLIALLLIARGAFAQAPPVPDFTALEAIVAQELKDLRAPGATVAVVSGDRVVYVKAFGSSNVETGAPMTSDMLFRLGSTTKMFTAAALVSLAEKGKIDLHKPIGAYVTGLDPGISQVTGHQLLSHTSGILDEAPMYGSHDESALSSEVRRWTNQRFFTEPGRVYSYSNPAYWLAGFVIEMVSGKLYADQMHESLFLPLGMARTTLRPTVAMTYPLALGHDAPASGPATVVRPAANNAASWPAGSIFSNVLDLSRFVTAFVNGGRLDGRQALPASVIARLTTPAVRIPGSDNSYGYGLNIGTYRGVRVLQHGGSRSGYGSVIRMAPDHRFGVIVLANRTGVSLNRTADKAMEVMLPLEPARPSASATPVAMTDAQLSAYVGTYSQGARTLQIVKKDGKLFLKQETRETEIRRMGDRRFTSGLVFVAGENGRIEYAHTGGRAWRRISNP